MKIVVLLCTVVVIIIDNAYQVHGDGDCPCWSKSDLRTVTADNQGEGSCVPANIYFYTPWRSNSDQRFDSYYLGKYDGQFIGLHRYEWEDSRGDNAPFFFVSKSSKECERCDRVCSGGDCEISCSVQSINEKEADACISQLDERCDKIGIGGCPCFGKDDVMSDASAGRTEDDLHCSHNAFESPPSDRRFTFVLFQKDPPYDRSEHSAWAGDEPKCEDSGYWYATAKFDNAEAANTCIQYISDVCDSIDQPFLPSVWDAKYDDELYIRLSRDPDNPSELDACEQNNIEAVYGPSNSKEIVVFSLWDRKTGKRVFRNTEEIYPYMMGGDTNVPYDVRPTKSLTRVGSFKLIIDPQPGPAIEYYLDILPCDR